MFLELKALSFYLLQFSFKVTDFIIRGFLNLTERNRFIGTRTSIINYVLLRKRILR
jgi:hypothetical protein